MPAGEQWRRDVAAETARQAKARRTGGYKRGLRQDKWRKAQRAVLKQPPRKEADGDDQNQA